MRPAAVALVCLTCAAAVRPLWAAGPTPNELLETGGLGLLVQFHEAARQAGRSAAVPTTGQNAWGFTYTPTEALSPGFVWTKIVERGTTTYAPANQAPVRAEYVMRHAAHCRVWLDRLTEMPGDDGLWPNARARKQAFAREPDTWRALDVGDFGLASGQPVVSQVDAFAGPVRARSLRNARRTCSALP